MYDRGMLEKLTILAYTKPDYKGEPFSRFEAFVNPNELTLSYEIEYDSAQGAGTTGSRMNFKKMKPGDLALAFFLDGTGVNPPRGDVATAITTSRKWSNSFKRQPAITAIFTGRTI